MSVVTYDGVMSHIRTSHVTYEEFMLPMKETCHIEMSHVTFK